MKAIEIPKEMLRKCMIANIEKVDETMKMLDAKYPYLKNTLPVKCDTTPKTVGIEHTLMIATTKNNANEIAGK